mmetsp:Transcript_5808/g.13439  ORF Transcript_5808/g.13439 Transcript_5808/m.13439 type:complete len:225 (-) Transcript_5808:43-717(-)
MSSYLSLISSRSSASPLLLSSTMSARSALSFAESFCAAMRVFASSSPDSSRALSLESWVSGDTFTATVTWQILCIPVSNRRGTSRTRTEVPARKCHRIIFAITHAIEAFMIPTSFCRATSSRNTMPPSFFLSIECSPFTNKSCSFPNAARIFRYAPVPGFMTLCAISSASTIGSLYSSLNILDTVLLPQAIPPVRPTILIACAFTKGLARIKRWVPSVLRGSVR